MPMPTNADNAQQTTARQVAEWMVDQLEQYDELLQQATAYEIRERFGAEFVCFDAYGDLGIARKVLYQFRKLTGDSVVWVAVRSNWLEGYWRKRGPLDSMGRTQTLD